MSIPKFYKSENDFKKIHHNLKHYKCPFCNLIGYLNLHGYLKGYDFNGNYKDVLRGHRIFCSNRNKRGGCGRTLSILLSLFIKHFILTANTIWNFFINIANGNNKWMSFKKANPRNPAPSSAYRLWRRFKANQSYLKTWLITISLPPPYSGNNPNIQTILHLKKTFSLNPIADFQLKLQSSFFGNPLPVYGLLK